MNLYLSDTHFGHANVINFDKRPFADVDEMNEMMIRFWNGRVQHDDDVWFLGDFCHKSGHEPDWYLKRLVGKKHLIVGNHDLPILKSPSAMAYFESVDQITRITDTYKRENVDVVLCHYPILQWEKKHHGAWHVYGHIHTDTGETFEIMSKFECALNAAAAINNYTPVSLRELVENNQRFQKMVRRRAYVNDRYAGKNAKQGEQDFFDRQNMEPCIHPLTEDEVNSLIEKGILPKEQSSQKFSILL